MNIINNISEAKKARLNKLWEMCNWIKTDDDEESVHAVKLFSCQFQQKKTANWKQRKVCARNLSRPVTVMIQLVFFTRACYKTFNEIQVQRASFIMYKFLFLETSFVTTVCTQDFSKNNFCKLLLLSVLFHVDSSLFKIVWNRKQSLNELNCVVENVVEQNEKIRKK